MCPSLVCRQGLCGFGDATPIINLSLHNETQSHILSIKILSKLIKKEAAPLESLHYLLMKAQTRMHRRICAQAAELGLTSGQPKILEYLLQYGESNQKAIADYCEVEQATIGSILMRMEASGLVVRSQHAGNRRSLYVALTSAGQEAAERMEHIFIHSEAEVCAALTAEEQLQLRTLLDKLCNSSLEEAWSHES